MADSVGPIDIEEGIEHHQTWRARLLHYIANPDGSLSAEFARNETNCELGKWLRNDGMRFSTLHSYEGLQLEHARFHRIAAQLVELAERGESASAAPVVEALARLNSASDSIIKALASLKGSYEHDRH